MLIFQCTTLCLHSTIMISLGRNGVVFYNGLNVLNDLNGLNFPKSLNHMSPLDSYTPKSENDPNLGDLCAFAGGNSRIFFPAKTLSSQRKMVISRKGRNLS